MHLQKDKEVFKVTELPAEEFAASLGLPGAPKIKFLSKEKAKEKKNASRAVAALQAEIEKEQGGAKAESSDEGSSSDEGEDASEDEAEKPEQPTESKVTYFPFLLFFSFVAHAFIPAQSSKVRTKYDRMFERKNQNILSSHYTKLVDHSLDPTLNRSGDASDSDDDFITLARADHALPGDDALPSSENISKRKLKAGTSKRAMLKYKGAPTKLVFDDEGKPHEVYEMKDVDDVFGEGKQDGDVKEAGKKFVESERGRLREADVRDKEEAKEKKKEKKRKRKEREREVHCLLLIFFSATFNS